MSLTCYSAVSDIFCVIPQDILLLVYWFWARTTKEQENTILWLEIAVIMTDEREQKCWIIEILWVQDV